MKMTTVWREGDRQRGQMWPSTYPQVAKYGEVYCGKGDLVVDDAGSLDFLPPLEQLTVMIAQLEKLRKDNGREHIVLLNTKYLDTAQLRNLVVLHDMKAIKYQVDKENEWFCKLNDYIYQPAGTTGLDSALPSTFKSMLFDTSGDYFWSDLQLKTREIKWLASNRWLSDLIIYQIIDLLTESNPHICLLLQLYH